MAAAAAAAAAPMVETSADEARSMLGSLITQLIAIVRSIVDHVVSIARQVLTYAGEHPLALALLVCNVMIWIA